MHFSENQVRVSSALSIFWLQSTMRMGSTTPHAEGRAGAAHRLAPLCSTVAKSRTTLTKILLGYKQPLKARMVKLGAETSRGVAEPNVPEHDGVFGYG